MSRAIRGKLLLEYFREGLFFVFCCVGWIPCQILLKVGFISMKERWRSLRPMDAFIAFNVAGKISVLITMMLVFIFYFIEVYIALFLSLLLIIISIPAYRYWLTSVLDKALVEQKRVAASHETSSDPDEN